jgi:hypothetical protein
VAQQHDLHRENKFLLLLRFQAIILPIKINKKLFLKQEKFPLESHFFINFKLTREFQKRKKKTK